MLLDRALRQVVLQGNALVGQTLQHQRQDFALAHRQAQFRRRHGQVAAARGLAALGGGLKPGQATQQRLHRLGKGLGRGLLVDEPMGTRLAHALHHVRVVVAADHRQGAAGAVLAQLGNQVQCRSFGQPEVDEGNGGGAAFGHQGQHVLGAARHGHLHPGQARAQELGHAACYQRVVVQDKGIG